MPRAKQHKICAIFDLDDTLAQTAWRSDLLAPLEGERKKNWPAFFSACARDPENERMVEIARAYRDAGIHLIVFTGRQELYKEMSLEWLAERGLSPRKSRFRRNESFQKDHVLKDQWAAQLIADGFEVVASFEDREANVEVFRKHGILTANALIAEEVEAVAAEGLLDAHARIALFNKLQQPQPASPSSAPAP